MFPSILIQLENGLNELYFTNSNGNISPGAVTGGNLINLAAIEKTKRKNITELQHCTGMSRREIKKMKKIFFFFFNFQKIGSGGSVKRKIKKTLALLNYAKAI